MSFLRKKTINGHEYWYEVENYREGAKVKQRVLKYIGKKLPKIRNKRSNIGEDEVMKEIENLFGGMIKLVKLPKSALQKIKKSHK